MLKLTLITSENDGFKLVSQADSPEEIKILESLTALLIEKIERIKVTVGYDSDE